MSLGQQAKALAEKDLRFDSLARIEILANACGVLVAILCALSGAEVFSLVLGYLATVTISSIGYLRIKGWRASLLPLIEFREITYLMHFGGRAVIVSLFNLIGAQADTIVMGRFFNTTTVGLYTQPRELTFRAMMTINPIVTRIGFPLIARAQGNKVELSRIYLNTILFTSSVNIPLFGFVFLFARQCTAVFLGPAWSASVPYMQAIAIWCMFRSIGNPMGSLLLGTGRVNRAMLSSLFVTIAVVISAVLAAQYLGAAAIAYVLAILYIILVPIFWVAHVKVITGLRFVQYHMTLVRPFISTLVAGMTAFPMSVIIHNHYLSLLAGGFVFFPIYFLVSFIVNKEWVISLLKMLRMNAILPRIVK